MKKKVGRVAWEKCKMCKQPIYAIDHVIKDGDE